MTRTAKELAELLGVDLEGDGGVELQNVAAPERAGARDLIYVESTKHAERAIASAARHALFRSPHRSSRGNSFRGRDRSGWIWLRTWRREIFEISAGGNRGNWR